MRVRESYACKMASKRDALQMLTFLTDFMGNSAPAIFKYHCVILYSGCKVNEKSTPISQLCVPGGTAWI